MNYFDPVKVFQDIAIANSYKFIYGSRAFQNWEITQQSLSASEIFLAVFPIVENGELTDGQPNSATYDTVIWIGRKYDPITLAEVTLDETAKQKYDKRLKRLTAYLKEVVLHELFCHDSNIFITRYKISHEINAFDENCDAVACELSFKVDYQYFNVSSSLPAFDNWYLPSRDEAVLIYTELYLYGLGNFNSFIHWTSSQGGATTGVGISFTSGGYSNYGKNLLKAVRACRLFTSTINYNLRDIGPAGGYIFWKSGNDYLELAPTDQSDGVVWSNIFTVSVGATGTAIGTGQSNTALIINQVGHTHSAAKISDDLSIVIDNGIESI
jgi:hypothetical protein